MQWHDEGLVLGCRRSGETGVILEAMTRDHGRHAGWVHGGRSMKLAPILQPGNTVAVTWRARLDEQLGHYTVEAKRMRAAALLDSPLALYGVAVLAAHLRLLPERDPHAVLYAAATHLADTNGAAEWAADLVRFELLLLAELGFGLDLSACAVTGTERDLTYVSPRSGRAVSRAAGADYAPRLLALPSFLVEEAAEPLPPAAANGPDVAAGLALTGFFLQRHVWEPRGSAPPPERSRLIARWCDVRGMSASDALAPASSIAQNEA